AARVAPVQRPTDGPVPGGLRVALPVAELVAAHPPVVAGGGVGVAVTAAVVPALRAARRVAVDVVARRAATERGAVGLPPTGGEAAGRAAVDAVVDRAAHDRPAAAARAL